MSSKPILYHHIFSPAVRAVLLTAAAIGIELDLKEVILSEKQHLSPEYLKVAKLNIMSNEKKKKFSCDFTR